jgi:hypothetical protein
MHLWAEPGQPGRPESLQFCPQTLCCACKDHSCGALQCHACAHVMRHERLQLHAFAMESIVNCLARLPCRLQKPGARCSSPGMEATDVAAVAPRHRHAWERLDRVTWPNCVRSINAVATQRSHGLVFLVGSVVCRIPVSVAAMTWVVESAAVRWGLKFSPRPSSQHETTR